MYIYTNTFTHTHMDVRDVEKGNLTFSLYHVD